ncbi:conserved hypothetical protein [Brochothrix thermosphacta]|nr:conserved hypothetical protein [Brochothrix thermosphacta]
MSANIVADLSVYESSMGRSFLKKVSTVYLDF